MKKIALLLLILVQACTAIINGPNTPIWDTGLFISVLDEEGNDLLNPDARYPKSINTNTIRLYHIIDGKESLVYNNSGESRWGYALLEPEGKYTNYRVRIAVNISSPTNIAEAIMRRETIIQWDKNRRDVLKTEIYRNGKGFTQLRNIWLNGELVWEWGKDDIDKQGFRFIEIRK